MTEIYNVNGAVQHAAGLSDSCVRQLCPGEREEEAGVNIFFQDPILSSPRFFHFLTRGEERIT